MYVIEVSRNLVSIQLSSQTSTLVVVLDITTFIIVPTKYVLSGLNLKWERHAIDPLNLRKRVNTFRNEWNLSRFVSRMETEVRRPLLLLLRYFKQIIISVVHCDSPGSGLSGTFKGSWSAKSGDAYGRYLVYCWCTRIVGNQLRQRNGCGFRLNPSSQVHVPLPMRWVCAVADFLQEWSGCVVLPRFLVPCWMLLLHDESTGNLQWISYYCKLPSSK